MADSYGQVAVTPEHVEAGGVQDAVSRRHGRAHAPQVHTTHKKKRILTMCGVYMLSHV